MSLFVGGNAITADDVSGTGDLKNYYDLPTGGLLFHASALNYTAGSPWQDSVQNIGMVAQSGTMAKATVGGIPCLSFDGTSYWDSTTADGNRVDMTGEFTLVLVFYAAPPPARKTIFEKIPNTYASYQQELACTWETDNNISFYTQVSDYDYGNFGVSTANQWNLRAIKMRADRQEAYAWNGGAWGSNVLTNRSNTQVVRSNGLRIGGGYSGTVAVGHIHAVLIYGVALTTGEMAKVHNYHTNLFAQFGATLYN
jgi:hypothetical protein